MWLFYGFRIGSDRTFAAHHPPPELSSKGFRKGIVNVLSKVVRSDESYGCFPRLESPLLVQESHTGAEERASKRGRCRRDPSHELGPGRHSGGVRCSDDLHPQKTGTIQIYAAQEGKFAKFWRACSRLYQDRFLQVNMRLSAFFKLCKICTLLNSVKLRILPKHRL